VKERIVKPLHATKKAAEEERERREGKERKSRSGDKRKAKAKETDKKEKKTKDSSRILQSVKRVESQSIIKGRGKKE